MRGSRTVLSVDIGPVTTVAVVDRGGYRRTVCFDDRISVPTPVLDGDGRDLITAVTGTRREGLEPVLAALAEHLRTVAAHAGPVDVTVVTAPAHWGPSHLQVLTHAAQAAGLQEMHVVSDAAAVATHTYGAPPDAAIVLACQLGEQVSQATVLQRHGRMWQRLATRPIAAATGQALDHALAESAGVRPPVSGDLREQLAHARPRLMAGHDAALLTPDATATHILTAADMHKAVSPLREAAADAIADVLDAAGVHADTLHGTVIYGETAALLAPSAEALDRIGLTTVTTIHARHTAAHGALDSVPGTPTTLGLPERWWHSAGLLAAPMVCAAAGIGLLWQIFDRINSLIPASLSRIAGDYEKLAVYFDTAVFALAACVLTVACLATGRNLAAALLADPAGRYTRQAGRLYAFSGLIGVVVAVLQSLLAQTLIGGPPEQAPPYLTSALAGAAVPATAAIGIGLSAAWLHAGNPIWTDRLRYPITSMILAAGGVMAIYAHGHRAPDTLGAVLGLAGAGLIGVAIALTVVTQTAARIALGILLGLGCMLLVRADNLHNVTIIYLAGAGLWWMRRAGRIAADNMPDRWRSLIRLPGSDTADRPSP